MKPLLILVLALLGLTLTVKAETICGTPKCNLIGSVKKCAYLFCKGVYVNCPGVLPSSRELCQNIPQNCGPDSSIITAISCAGDNKSASYSYYCASQDAYRFVFRDGPECCVENCQPTVGDDPPKACPPPDFLIGTGNWDICASPIVIDLTGMGFNFTNPTNGVLFDVAVDGHLEQIAWPAVGARNAWLAFDRDGNGIIDDGTELFGDFTDQAPSTEPNGFRALAKFDSVDIGGNGDGIISSEDAIFESLVLWEDVNHNGYSESSELTPFSSVVGSTGSISLTYEELKVVDQHGNEFRYRAVVSSENLQVGDWAYDVFLVKE